MRQATLALGPDAHHSERHYARLDARLIVRPIGPTALQYNSTVDNFICLPPRLEGGYFWAPPPPSGAKTVAGNVKSKSSHSHVHTNQYNTARDSIRLRSNMWVWVRENEQGEEKNQTHGWF